jgi:thiol-disulfide isomerase/thioredoxin
MTSRALLFSAILLTTLHSVAQTSSPAFDGVEKWKTSLTPAGMFSFKTLYSSNPPAQFVPKGQQPTPDLAAETDFWQKLVSSMTGFDVRTVEQKDRNGMHLVTLAVSMKMKTPQGLRPRYVTEQQGWQQQADGWRIVIATHSDVVKMPPALKPNPHLYDAAASARTEIDEAVAKAKKLHQRVLLVFGANWCYDCHVLDNAFHQIDVEHRLAKSFQVVHVDIGDDGKKNNDIAAEYEVPLSKGIPALAVLDSGGELVYSQKNGEWESARSMDPADIITFLDKWKP